MIIFVHYKYFTFILRNSPGVIPNLRLNDLIYDCSYSKPYIIAISKTFKLVFSKSSLLADNFRERIYLPIDRLNAALKRRRKLVEDMEKLSAIFLMLIFSLNPSSILFNKFSFKSFVFNIKC